MNSFKFFVLFFVCSLLGVNLFSKTYYVSANKGNDKNIGTLQEPFKTIQKAADLLTASDTCYIREGTYRELVQPVNSGISENKRIVYKAYPGENPVLTGSERIDSWTSQDVNLYKAVINNSFFGSYNPFSINLCDPNGWLWYGTELHLGTVYINGEAYIEKRSGAEVSANPKSFYAEANNLTTTIWISYSGTKNPNIDLTEISVRPSVIKPRYRGKCNFITLDGLTIRHGSTNWSSNEGIFSGMIDINAGGWWTIRNCHISDGRTCGVQAGMSQGHHLIINNLIERFGQCGLVGNNGGWFSSMVEGNIFQDINTKNEFGGAETAAFKSHNTVDLTIKNNIFRRINVYRNGWAFAIWIDWRNQGNRITGNVFSDLKNTAAIEIECDHGPTLIDNNIFALSSDSSIAVKHNSSNVIVVHNLFINAIDGHYHSSIYQKWYKPHTRTVENGDTIRIFNDKSYNNIFIGGNNFIPLRTGYACDFNAYLQDALKCSWSDTNSHSNPDFKSDVTIENSDSSTIVFFRVDEETVSMKCPLISNSFIGSCDPTGQGIEKNDGSPVSINTDIIGAQRSNVTPKVGPIENLRQGTNKYSLVAGIKK
ncbi:MAG TPA: right-handed parallel beta-helix repeat-containing protein [Bacteroidales bacterium]